MSSIYSKNLPSRPPPWTCKQHYGLTSPGNSRGRLFHSVSHLPILFLHLTEGSFSPESISDHFKNTGHTDTPNRIYDDKIQVRTNFYLYQSHKQCENLHTLSVQLPVQRETTDTWEARVSSLPELSPATASNCSYLQKPGKLPKLAI